MSLLFTVLNAPIIELPGGEPAAMMVLRWIHFIAGITWVGLLYFFTLINAPFLGELEPGMRGPVMLKLLPRALWWFRWSALLTVLVGLAYWGHIVGLDARSAAAAGERASVGALLWSFFLLWTAAFVIEMGALMAPPEFLRRGPVLGALVALAVVAASYLFVTLNQHGWESNRTLAIGIGGGIGWFMLLNVWGVVWRMQKKVLRWTETAAPGCAMPPELAKAARLSLLCARLNFWLSFPMLFFMGAASHYGMFVSR